MNIKQLRNLLLIPILFISMSTSASHLMGGQITYTHVSGDIYKITLTLYRDCDGITLGSSAAISVSGAASFSESLLRTAVNDVSILCPGEVSECNGGSTPGIEEHIYQGNVTLNTAGTYTFSYNVCCRNSSITTLIPNIMYLSTDLNTLLTPGNSSPNFLNKPIGNYCIGAPSSLSPNGTDADGDVIVYSLVNARIGSATSASYSAGFSGLNPLTSSSPIVINPNTGVISFTPSAASTQVAVIAFKAEEYRVISGVSTKIGEVYRDIQVRLAACGSNGAPVLSPVPNAIVQVGQNYCVNINATDAPTQNITLTAVSSILPPATFNVISSGLGFTNSTFCFTPQASDAGNTYTVSVNAQDDVCGSVTTSVRTWNITVPNAACNVSISSSSTDETCATNDGTATANLVGGTPAYSYSWTGPGGFTSFAGPTITGLVAGTYDVNISDGNGCAETKIIIVGDACALPPTCTSPFSVTLTPKTVNTKIWGSAVADPYTFFFGVTQWKKMKASVSGGTGPFTYDWGTITSGQIKPRGSNPKRKYLFQPLADCKVYVNVTDQATSCVYGDTIDITFNDDYFCGTIDPNGKISYSLEICDGGITKCVPWVTAKNACKAKTATLGLCKNRIKREVVSAIDFKVYPNPAREHLNISYTAVKDAKGTLRLMDTKGSILTTETFNVSEGLFVHSIDVSQYNPGLYMVYLEIDGEVFVERVQVFN